tara:strand:+ start:3573 stop:3923 length:351 start_codon:yes stop_codon:yes gene_type:complete
MDSSYYRIQDNNIVTEENQNEFLVYAIEERSNNISAEIYQFYLELHLNDLIENKTTWKHAAKTVSDIIKTQNIIEKKVPLKPKNTRPTDRKEKANLLAEAALKRINKSVFKKRKKI